MNTIWKFQQLIIMRGLIMFSYFVVELKWGNEMVGKIVNFFVLLLFFFLFWLSFARRFFFFLFFSSPISWEEICKPYIFIAASSKHLRLSHSLSFSLSLSHLSFYYIPSTLLNQRLIIILLSLLLHACLQVLGD